MMVKETSTYFVRKRWPDFWNKRKNYVFFFIIIYLHL